MTTYLNDAQELLESTTTQTDDQAIQKAIALALLEIAHQLKRLNDEAEADREREGLRELWRDQYGS